MTNEPGAAILATFDQLINRVKQAHPVRSDGKPLGGGMVYSMMTLGMPVDPLDYRRPWSPMGGASLQELSSKGELPNAGGAPATAADAAGDAAPAPDPKYARAMEAAYKTAQLGNILLQVTTDGTYLEYPTGRHLDFGYEGLLSSMQPGPMPPIDPAVQKQIDDAQKILYELDEDDGSIIGRTKLFKTYQKNAQAYALAKANYATAMADARSNPAKAEVWPMTSATYQQAVDEAYDTLKTEGAEKVERALDIIGSVGVCMQDHMVKKARQLFDAYNLGLAGVPAPIPYTYISPSGWCEPDRDDDGWQELTVTAGDYEHFDASNRTMGGQHSWSTDQSSTGGSGGVLLGFAAFGGSAGGSSASSQWQGSSQQQFTSSFKNTAKNLKIKLQYALCTIVRPWLVSDLFYMRNWYTVGGKKNSISDGTEANQANISDVDKLPFLPMIPQQMLVVRGVEISTSDWGDDGQLLDSYFGTAQGSSSSSSSHEAGSAGVSLGFISFGGSASHDESHAEGQGSSWSSRTATGHYGTTFENNTLRINGAQIIAFLSDIVPACPPLDDPALANAQEAQAAANADALQPAA
ncbi:MAG: hypothetical protein ABI612_03905 [Betaproteobacteria bacterium]